MTGGVKDSVALEFPNREVRAPAPFPGMPGIPGMPGMPGMMPGAPGMPPPQQPQTNDRGHVLGEDDE